MIEVLVNNRQRIIKPLNKARLVEAVRRILVDSGFVGGEVSLAIVADDEMQRLNAQWLQHDYPTDVLSFVLDECEHSLDGEIIVSAETAKRQAAEYGWQAADELLLYVIHGTLHLVGHDDHEDHDRAAMRMAEAQQLAHFGLRPRYDE